MTGPRTWILLAAVLAAALAGGARAASAGQLQVQINSKPDGATLYLDSRDTQPIGRTPYKGKLEEGTYTLIVELDGYEASVQTIRVKKKKGEKLVFNAELAKLRSATLVIKAAPSSKDAEGARIVIDGVEQGNVKGTKDTITVLAGPHQVEVQKDGYETFEAWVEPAEGEILEVEVKLEPESGNGKRAGKGKKGGRGNRVDADGEIDDGEETAGGDGEEGAASEDGGGDGEDGGEDDGDIQVGVTPVLVRGPLAVVSLGLEFGFRGFSFQKPETPNLRDYDVSFVPMGRIGFEVYPLATIAHPVVAGIGLAGSYGRATPIEATTRDGRKVGTTWSEWDIAGRYQYNLGGGNHVGLEAGLGGQAYHFSVGEDTDDLMDELPEVSYRFQRIGLDARGRFAGRYSMVGSVGYRKVTEVGLLASRFADSRVSSFSLSVGFGYLLTRALDVRMTGSFLNYGYDFTPREPPDDDFVADGGTDRFFGIAFDVAYTY